MVRPKRVDARRASLRATAPGGGGFPGLAIPPRRNDRSSAAGSDGVMALAGVECAISGDAGDFLIGRDLVEQFGQHGRVTNIAGGELGCADFHCLLINSDVDLAPDAPFGAAVLARVPLTFALDLDPGAVDQEVQRALRGAVGDVNLQALLAAAEGAEVRHSPVQVDQPQQALDEPSRLAERHAEKNFHRQTCLDRGIAIVRLPATFSGGLRLPGHGGIEPDRQRTAALEGCVVVRPVPGLVGGGYGSAHAVQLPRWIHKMNPSRDLCNRAPWTQRRYLRTICNLPSDIKLQSKTAQPLAHLSAASADQSAN